MDSEALYEIISRNLSEVRARVTESADAAGRNADEITLVAVTKYAEPEWVSTLSRLHSVLGESRPQQLVSRAAGFDPDIQWHLIGQLQRNKVRPVLPLCRMIHSVDSWRLLDRIDLIAEELGLTPSVLLEVNVSGEAAKAGFTAADLRSEFSRAADYGNVDIVGLMTMAPRTSDPEASRPFFRSLRELRDELAEDGTVPLRELSMGMSGDYEVAISEGATIVRVGSRLFDELGYRA